jgi:hypothetical protein
MSKVLILSLVKLNKCSSHKSLTLDLIHQGFHVTIAQALYVVCTCLSKGIETIGNVFELGTNDMNTVTN